MYTSNNPSITLSEGNEKAKICILTGVPSWEGKPLTEVCKNLILDTAQRAGISESDIRFECVLGVIPPGRKHFALEAAQIENWKEVCRARLEKLDCNVFVPLGDLALETLTEHKSSDKWQLSIIQATKVKDKKTIPLIHPERVLAAYSEIPFLIFGMQRVYEEMNDARIKSVARIFHTNPTYDQAMNFLSQAVNAEYLSVDIETAQGQITCVGFGSKITEAMCIPTLPSHWAKDQLFNIWKMINKTLTGKSKKIFQNYIYDCSYFSKYGIAVQNLWHDTMHAQKFLHPELPKGLDTIARLYTREPYWKDEGKDWKNVGDINKFWIYNTKDVVVTMEAAFEQRKDLKARNLTENFEKLVMEMAAPAAEMCWRGLPIDYDRRKNVTTEVVHLIDGLSSDLNRHAQTVLGKDLNARSPKQVKIFFKAKGYRLPVKKGKETSDATALMKLQQRYPNDPTLPILLQLSEKNKLLSSYLKPMPYADGRFRFSLDIHGTDTGRWSCRKDPWDNGFNAQTISSELKKMFRAPPGYLWLEVDLRQADSRFVAWDAPEPTLIKFYSENIDIHRFVAARPELFNKPLDQISKDERQLGKKVGHASNYGMRGSKLSEICLLEMGISVPSHRADQMLEGYHRVFPGIRMWQQRIASEVRKTKRLRTPMGRERYFYDRISDELFRVAYAYRPQSTVADITNQLIKHVAKNRDDTALHFALQAHDAAIMLIKENYIDQAIEIIKDEQTWNPKLVLSGGILQIPIEAKAGEIWGEAKEIKL